MNHPLTLTNHDPNILVDFLGVYSRLEHLGIALVLLPLPFVRSSPISHVAATATAVPRVSVRWHTWQDLKALHVHYNNA